jgi:REP element-mobilizing transposase RayT
MVLNPFGKIVQKCWEGLARVNPNVLLDAFVVMPNHVHGVIILTDDHLHPLLSQSPPKGKPLHGIAEIIRGFKTITARLINQKRNSPGKPLWQRNYFDRVVRNEKELSRVRKYILDNPVQWEVDHDNPDVKIRNAVPDPWGDL